MQVVVRALAILKLIAGSDEPRSLTDVAAELNLPLPTVHRFLALLTDLGYLSREPGERMYSVGPELLDVLAPRRRSALITAASPIMDELNVRFDETIFLGAIAGDNAICVARATSRRQLRLNVSIGDTLPWHAAASARAILACLPPDVARAYLAKQVMDRFTAKTPETREDVERHLENVRGRGYDICDDELDHGVWAVAVPIVANGGTVYGSIAMGAPATRLKGKTERQTAIGAIRDAARQISGKLT